MKQIKVTIEPSFHEGYVRVACVVQHGAELSGTEQHIPLSHLMHKSVMDHVWHGMRKTVDALLEERGEG